MAKNLYEDALETFSYDEMLASLSGVGAETGRLELKRELSDRPKIAHVACALANADGGIIAIGIDEASATTPLGVRGLIDVSDSARTGLIAFINARVYPPPPLDIYAYEDTRSSFMIVRVGRSLVAPHEYIAGDNYNLPVKRASLTSRLTLAEIDSLRLRSQNVYNESPLGQRMDWVTLNQWGSGPDFMVGVAFSPQIFLSERRTLEVDDDQLCEQIARQTMGVNGALHKKMKSKVMIDSHWLYSDVQGDPSTYGTPQPEHQIEIASDGRVIVKFLEQETKETLWSLLQATLVTGYVAAQRVCYAFGIGPRVRAHVVMRLSARAREEKIAQGYDDYFPIDLAAQPYADAFLATFMRMLRAANQNSKRNQIRDEVLQAFVNTEIPIADELQRRWLA